MNRVPSVTCLCGGAALILYFGVSRMQAQEPATPPQAQADKPTVAPPAQKPAEGDDGRGRESICSAAGSAAARGDDGVRCERSALPS